MIRNRHLRLIFVFFIIGIVTSTVYYYNKMNYDKIHNLIEEDELNIVSWTYVENGEVVLKIDASQNATYIKVKDTGYVIDNNQLFEILSKYKCKKSKTDYFPYTADDIAVKISLTQNHRPKHILLGKFNIWYESADKKSYDIIDGDKLLNEILLLVKEKY